MKKFIQPTLFSNHDCDSPICAGRCVVQESEPGIRVIWHVDDSPEGEMRFQKLLKLLFEELPARRSNEQIEPEEGVSRGARGRDQTDST